MEQLLRDLFHFRICNPAWGELSIFFIYLFLSVALKTVLKASKATIIHYRVPEHFHFLHSIIIYTQICHGFTSEGKYLEIYLNAFRIQ